MSDKHRLCLIQKGQQGWSNICYISTDIYFIPKSNPVSSTGSTHLVTQCATSLRQIETVYIVQKVDQERKKKLFELWIMMIYTATVASVSMANDTHSSDTK